MKLEIDETQLTEQLNRSVSSVIHVAFDHWDVRHALTQLIATAVSRAELHDALSEGIKHIISDDMAASISKEVQRVFLASVTSLLEESVARLVADIRGVSEYGEARAKALKEIRNELFRRE